ncbi:Scr1 family TA system antitoxin-like transcriptional regulator, partial [Streptomyces sp. SID6139]|nr:transcriptional regulator [Streptomyces sp. SID6139]
IGGKMVMRGQLERLLEASELPNIDLQVLPLGSEENSGLDGLFRLLKLKDGTNVGLSEAPLVSRVLCNPKETTALDMRYGIIRAQALTPRNSLALIEKVLGET